MVGLSEWSIAAMNDLGSNVQLSGQPHTKSVPEIAVAEKPVLVAVDFSPESEAVPGGGGTGWLIG
jgi:hypothetical protein